MAKITKIGIIICSILTTLFTLFVQSTPVNAAYDYSKYNSYKEAVLINGNIFYECPSSSSVLLSSPISAAGSGAIGSTCSSISNIDIHAVIVYYSIDDSYTTPLSPITFSFFKDSGTSYQQFFSEGQSAVFVNPTNTLTTISIDFNSSSSFSQTTDAFSAGLTGGDFDTINSQTLLLTNQLSMIPRVDLDGTRLSFLYGSNSATSVPLLRLSAQSGGDNWAATTVSVPKTILVYDYKYSPEQAQNEAAQHDLIGQDNIQNQDSSGDEQGIGESSDNLIGVFTGFVGAVTSASAGNCILSLDMGYLDFGDQDLCQFDLPVFVPIISSIVLIVIFVPLSISLFNRIMAQIRSMQNG